MQKHGFKSLVKDLKEVLNGLEKVIVNREPLKVFRGRVSIA